VLHREAPVTVHRPKGTGLTAHTPKDLDTVTAELNSRPRKALK
jgi:IS30 family transposase